MRKDIEAYALELKTQIEKVTHESTIQIEAVKSKASDWSVKFKASVVGLLDAGAGLGESGGKRGGKDQQSMSPTVDRKGVAVWKLPEHVSKQEFRHWVDTIDTNLDAPHGFNYLEMVLDKVKRSEVEVNEGNRKLIIAMVNTEVPANKLIDVEIAKGKARSPEGFSGGADPWHEKQDILEDCNFEEKSRFLYTFLLSKLNTELHGKMLGIEGRNGFELYRQIVRAVEMTKFIDERLRVIYGHVEFHSPKDGPMSNFAMGARDPDPAEPIPAQGPSHGADGVCS